MAVNENFSHPIELLVEETKISCILNLIGKTFRITSERSDSQDGKVIKQWDIKDFKGWEATDDSFKFTLTGDLEEQIIYTSNGKEIAKYLHAVKSKSKSTTIVSTRIQGAFVNVESPPGVKQQIEEKRKYFHRKRSQHYYNVKDLPLSPPESDISIITEKSTSTIDDSSSQSSLTSEQLQSNTFVDQGIKLSDVSIVFEHNTIIGNLIQPFLSDKLVSTTSANQESAESVSNDNEKQKLLTLTLEPADGIVCDESNISIEQRESTETTILVSNAAQLLADQDNSDLIAICESFGAIHLHLKDSHTAEEESSRSRDSHMRRAHLKINFNTITRQMVTTAILRYLRAKTIFSRCFKTLALLSLPLIPLGLWWLLDRYTSMECSVYTMSWYLAGTFHYYNNTVL